MNHRDRPSHPVHLPSRRKIALAAAGAALLSACGGGGDGDGSGDPSPDPSPPPSSVTASRLSSGLGSPSSLAFLPDGRLLVTTRPGQVWLFSQDASTRQMVAASFVGLTAAGQGGLLDVVLHPNHAVNGQVYFTYVSSAGGSHLRVLRAELQASVPQLVNAVVIYQGPPSASSEHFGGRMAFDGQGHLFLTLGERQQRNEAQNMASPQGKVLRFNADGSIPASNPFYATAVGDLRAIWSIGHRNPQGIARHPVTGEMWISEHGPQGGDEVNIVRAGLNYGWPLISHGQEYGTTTQVGSGTSGPGLEQPVSVWETIDGTPWVGGQKRSIAPSGAAFFTGPAPSGWQGSLFVGALAGQALWRLQLSGNAVVSRERLLAGMGERIRDVRQGPDGRLYLLTDSGALLRVNA